MRLLVKVGTAAAASHDDKICFLTPIFAATYSSHALSPPFLSLLPRLLNAGVKGLHLYTLNQEEACFQILEELGLKKPIPADL